MVDKKEGQRKSNRERFEKLAELRVNKVIDQLRLIGNLSDKRHYEYTEQEKKKIILAINNEFNKTKTRFEESSKKIGEFKLRD